MFKQILSPLTIIAAMLLLSTSCDAPLTEEEKYTEAVKSLEDLNKNQKNIDSIIRFADKTHWEFDSLSHKKSFREVQLKVAELAIQGLQKSDKKNALIERYKTAVEASYDVPATPPPPPDGK